MSLHRHQWLLSALLAVAVLGASLLAPTPAAATPDTADITAFIDARVAELMAEGGVPGVTVSVVQNGEILLAKGYGIASRDTGEPVDGERTLFRVASVTKLMTVMAVLSLVDDGVLDLHTDVNDYLHTVKVPESHEQPVTIDSILTHMSGFVGTSSYVHYDSDAETEMSVTAMQRLLQRARAPGELRSYDNTGFGLLGMIIADATGKPFREVMAERVFRPLGMTHSVIGLPDEVQARASDGHTISLEEAGDLPFTPQAHLGTLVEAAGAASSTAADMARFMLALQNGTEYPGGRILSPEAYGRMMDLDAGRAHPEVPGLGYAIYETDYKGRRAVGHGGLIDGFTSELALLPDAGLGIFVSSNVGTTSPPMGIGLILVQMRVSPEVMEAATKAMGVSRGLVEAVAETFAPPRDSWGPAGVGGDTALAPNAIAGRFVSGPASASLTFTGKLFARGLGGMQVEAVGDNAISAYGRVYEQVAPGFFRHPESDRSLAFIRRDGHVLQVSAPIGWSERVSASEGPLFTVLPLFLGPLLLLTGLVYWRGSAHRPAGANLPGRIWGTAAVVVITAIVLEMQYAEYFIYGRGSLWLPLFWRLSLHAALIALLLAPVLYLAQLRRQAAWAGWRRVARQVHCAILSLAGLAVVVSAFYWDLFGNLTT